MEFYSVFLAIIIILYSKTLKNLADTSEGPFQDGHVGSCIRVSKERFCLKNPNANCTNNPKMTR